MLSVWRDCHTRMINWKCLNSSSCATERAMSARTRFSFFLTDSFHPFRWLKFTFYFNSTFTAYTLQIIFPPKWIKIYCRSNDIARKMVSKTKIVYTKTSFNIKHKFVRLRICDTVIQARLYMLYHRSRYFN